mmetsp:Transcript_13836/g.35303  ORF Transcript_13836/g.35303 Transcript_13836/m.35303 type:complete len:235 (+) Transcript_13836:1871-2575(+)
MTLVRYWSVISSMSSQYGSLEPTFLSLTTRFEPATTVIVMATGEPFRKPSRQWGMMELGSIFFKSEGRPDSELPFSRMSFKRFIFVSERSGSSLILLCSSTRRCRLTMFSMSSDMASMALLLRSSVFSMGRRNSSTGKEVSLLFFSSRCSRKKMLAQKSFGSMDSPTWSRSMTRALLSRTSMILRLILGSLVTPAFARSRRTAIAASKNTASDVLLLAIWNGTIATHRSSSHIR